MTKTGALAQLVERTPIGWLARRAGWRGIVTLTYHRIGDERSGPYHRPLWSASTEEFDAQLAFLTRNADVISPSDLLGDSLRPSGRYVLLTFDDGYLDNYEAAFPILRGRSLPATFFLTTTFLDGTRLSSWDEVARMVNTGRGGTFDARPWHEETVVIDPQSPDSSIERLTELCRSLPNAEIDSFLDRLAEETGTERPSQQEVRAMWMTWEMAREMRDGGMAFGGHTVTHPWLGRLSPDDQSAEISGCRARFEAELGRPMELFSYPFGKVGSFDEATKRALAANGVRACFANGGGYLRPGPRDAYDLPRTNISPDIAGARFRAITAAPALFARW